MVRVRKSEIVIGGVIGAPNLHIQGLSSCFPDHPGPPRWHSTLSPHIQQLCSSTPDNKHAEIDQNTSVSIHTHTDHPCVTRPAGHTCISSTQPDPSCTLKGE